MYGTRPVDPVERAAWLWSEQRRLREQTRLGIPAIVHEECLTGLAAWKAATFPTPLAWGASFDPALVEEMGRLIGDSMRQLGIHQGLAPVLDVIRDPRWGRVDECIAEDPYVVGTIGTAYVRGCRMPASTPRSSTSSATRPPKPGAIMRRSTSADASSPTCCSRPSRWRSATAVRARS